MKQRTFSRILSLFLAVVMLASTMVLTATTATAATVPAGAEVWDGQTVSTSLEQDGENYLINSAADFVYFLQTAAAQATASDKFILCSDIYFSSATPVNFASEEGVDFAGSFVGNGYTVWNLAGDNGASAAYVFGTVTGSISDVEFKGLSLSSTSDCAFIRRLEGTVEYVDFTEMALTGANVAPIGTVAGSASVVNSTASGTVNVVETTTSGASAVAASYTLVRSSELAVASTSTDFDPETMGSNTSYGDKTSTNGWVAKYSAMNNKFTSPNYTVCLNGKTSAAGTLTSPTISGGIASLSFSYGLPFSESNGVDLQLNIKQGDTVVATYQLDDNSVAGSGGSSSFTWTLDTPVSGDFVIEIVNNCPSGKNSNKDRTAIWDLTWTGYAAGGDEDAPTYTITYEGMEDATHNNPSIYQEGSDITLVAPSKDGYNFLGWTYEGQDEPQLEVTITEATGDLTFTANWEEKPVYTITYEGVDGATHSNPTSYHEGDTIALVSPVLAGYVFIGWTYEGQTTPTKTVSIASATGNLSFTANWEEEPAADSTLTIPEANALGEKKDSDTYTTNKYYVSGVITNIASTTYGNMTIQDADGNTLYLYGLYSADGSTRYDAMETKPAVGDTITVYGVIGQFYGTAQMKNAWMTSHTPAEDEGGEGGEEGGDTPVVPSESATITFDDTSKRTDGSTESQTWTENGIVVLHEKASSTTDINLNYYNPIRWYKGSSVTVQYSNMVKLVFTCASASYATVLGNSISGATVDGSVVTVELASAQNSFKIEAMSAQVRVNSIEVFAASSEGGEETGYVAGGMIGTVESASCTLSGIFTDVTVTVSSENAQYVGGIVGHAAEGTALTYSGAYGDVALNGVTCEGASIGAVIGSVVSGNVQYVVSTSATQPVCGSFEGGSFLTCVSAGILAGAGTYTESTCFEEADLTQPEVLAALNGNNNVNEHFYLSQKHGAPAPVAHLKVSQATVMIGDSIAIVFQVTGVNSIDGNQTFAIADGADKVAELTKVSDGVYQAIVSGIKLSEIAAGNTYTVRYGGYSSNYSVDVSVVSLLAGIYGSSTNEEKAVIEAMLTYAYVAGDSSVFAIFNAEAGTNLACADLSGISEIADAQGEVISGSSLDLADGFVIVTDSGNTRVSILKAETQLNIGGVHTSVAVMLNAYLGQAATHDLAAAAINYYNAVVAAKAAQ